MSAVQRKQCPRCGRFLPDTARVHWPCVLARLTQTWFVRLPAALLGGAALLALLATLLMNVPRLLLSAPAPAASVAATAVSAPIELTASAPTSETIAEVIVAEAALYAAPGANASLVRTAASGERFAITAQADTDGLWYQVQTETGPLWVAAFSVAVAGGSPPILAITASAPTSAAFTDGAAAPPTPTLALAIPSTPTVPAAPAPAACIATARTTAVLYSGPGTSFAAVDALGTGQSVALDGQASDSGGGVWWRARDSGLWVSSADMDGGADCANLPFAAAGSQLPPTPISCPDAQPTRLRLGGRARALTDDTALARAAGGSEIVAPLVAGQELAVIGGPVCAPLGLASVTWWELQAAPGIIGWAYEEAGGVYYFAPLE